MNLPNKLTILRILLIPTFILAYFIQNNIAYGNIIACIIFCGASFTDFLDGYIARKYKLVTDFGKFMDPLADKLLVCTALILFTWSNYINPVVVIVIVGRDFIISGIRLIAASHGKVIAASYWGKIKTVVQMLMIILILLHFDNRVYNIITFICVVAAFILTIVSLVDYIWKNRNFIKDM